MRTAWGHRAQVFDPICGGGQELGNSGSQMTGLSAEDMSPGITESLAGFIT